MTNAQLNDAFAEDSRFVVLNCSEKIFRWLLMTWNMLSVCHQRVWRKLTQFFRVLVTFLPLIVFPG